jgi:pimeloyl-ACP methyl ester carboxylesterase
LLIILFVCCFAVHAEANRNDPAPAAKPTGMVIPYQPQSFQQYQTTDKLGRTITFYLSQPDPAFATVPLALYIGGSGGGSLFSKDAHGAIHGNPNYEFILDLLRKRARLLIVEKPGIKLFEEPKQWGVSEGCSEEFLREHTLDRWTEANSAAIEAARTLPGIDQRRLLVIGHSEGGQVCTHVAAINSHVTHVASIAGGGPTQLFDMIYNAQASGDSQAEEITNAWKDIEANKDSYSKFWAGHTYQRWYSFCTSSPLNDLLKSSAKAYIVQGTADTATVPVGFDVMRAELLAHNRPFVAERIVGGNHGLKVMQGKKVVADKYPEVMTRILDWFFAD